MLKFKLPASVLSSILNATSTRGHVFVKPSEEGVCFSNSKEEDDVSVYNMIPAESFDVFEYDGDEEDVYCFHVKDILPIVSRIQDDVVLNFDERTVNIISSDAKYKGSATLKDEEMMTKNLGYNEKKSRTRHPVTLKLGEAELVIPKIMTEFGATRLIKFLENYRPLLIDSDDVVLNIDMENDVLQQRIRTYTSKYEFSAEFEDSDFIAGDGMDFDKTLELLTTSNFLETAIKKHQSSVDHMLIIKIASTATPYNIIFISKYENDGKVFYTSSILTLRIPYD